MIKKVEIRGVNTSNLPLLNEDEKMDLFEKIKQGDRKARKKFINGNLRLVLSVLQHFNYRGEVDDLFQVGCIGLIKALDNFDTSHNVKFSTYAVPMIIGEVRRYIRDNNPIRVSRSLRIMAYRALMVQEKLRGKNFKEPTIKEIAEHLKTDKEEVVFALESIVDPLSLNEKAFSDDGNSIIVMDQLKDEKTSDEFWLNELSVSEAIKKLNKKEKWILKLRFFEGKTQNEVAKEIGVSQAQVSRLEKSAISRLRKFIVRDGD